MTIIDAHNHPDWHGYKLPRFLGDKNCFGTTRHLLLIFP